ncbi:GntR family transcriptional regulator [Paraburkholderia sp. RL18-103-BIB-C]|uniref:FadR/GntR family transcriptional regulator n=1 Tax=Paraburkholderia sp. RL18-103-BIB-C TaxID=3031637 RepID=UPI0038BA8A94
MGISKVEIALDVLVALVIQTGAGGKIPPQDELARQMGISRTVLREALSKLEFLNVVQIRPKLGTVVSAPNDWKTRNDEVIEWKARMGGVRTRYTRE